MRRISATTVGAGETGPPFLGWGTNNVLVPKLLGRGFQKAHNSNLATLTFDSSPTHVRLIVLLRITRWHGSARVF